VITEGAVGDLRAVCPEATEMMEGAVRYIYLPDLRLPAGNVPSVVEGLLRPGAGSDGYTSRLFLSHAFPTKGQNWTVHQIVAKTWHTPSFNLVPADLPLLDILANHLRVFV
jgi:hypothetical protein